MYCLFCKVIACWIISAGTRHVLSKFLSICGCVDSDFVFGLTFLSLIKIVNCAKLYNGFMMWLSILMPLKLLNLTQIQNAPRVVEEKDKIKTIWNMQRSN